MRGFLLIVAIVAAATTATYQLGAKFPRLAAFLRVRGDQDFAWPPRVGEFYPDLKLIDQEGQVTRLSDYKGKPILIEPIGMSCPGCQAFCGAHELGSYGGVSPQVGLESIHRLLAKHYKLDLESTEVVHVHLLLYNLNMRAPHAKEGKNWARHFSMDKSRNQLVLVGLPSMIGEDSYNMIPGFQLIDRDFKLKVDSTGHKPRHHLYRQLLPELSSMARRGSSKRFVVREF